MKYTALFFLLNFVIAILAFCVNDISRSYSYTQPLSYPPDEDKVQVVPPGGMCHPLYDSRSLHLAAARDHRQTPTPNSAGCPQPLHH